MQWTSQRDKEIVGNCFGKRAQAGEVYDFKNESSGWKYCWFPWNKQTQKQTPGIINSSFLSVPPSIIHSAVAATSWKDTNCSFLGCFRFTRPRWLVKPTISSFKLYHHSHVLIKKKSFLSENVKSGIRSVSKNVPRIMEKLAKTNTRGKSCHRLLNQVTALCSVLSPSLTHSLSSFPALALSPSPSLSLSQP